MTVFFIILGALAAVGLPLYVLHCRDIRNDGNGEIITPDSEQECCGQHAMCERDSLLAAMSKEIEYYDDEELDRFRGKSPADYSPEEEEEFRDVLLTLLPDDVAGWSRSIQLRGIELPDSVRDELLLIVGEKRFEHK